MRVCIICIMRFGFRVSDKEKTFETEEELYDHMENFHGAIVVREGETFDQAVERCRKKGIVKDKKLCQCEECKLLRGEKSKITRTGLSKSDIYKLFMNLN